MALPITVYPEIEAQMEAELAKHEGSISPAYHLLIAQTYRAFGHSVETLRLSGVKPSEVFEIMPGLFATMTCMFLTAVFTPAEYDDAEAVAVSIAETTLAMMPEALESMWGAPPTQQ